MQSTFKEQSIFNNLNNWTMRVQVKNKKPKVAAEEIQRAMK